MRYSDPLGYVDMGENRHPRSIRREGPALCCSAAIASSRVAAIGRDAPITERSFDLRVLDEFA